MDRKSIIKRINELTLHDDEQEAINLLCELIESPQKDEFIDLIYMLVDSFQLYGYADVIGIEKLEEFFNSNLFDFKVENYKGNYMNFFNNGQLSIIDAISDNNKIIISAPTSFGKTSLLIEYIIQNYYLLNNIIFIVPTNSLMEELYIKFLKVNKKIDNYYNISINTRKNDGKNIKILTPEKFLSFYEYYGLQDQNLIIMDETYKIENDGEQDGEVVDNRAFKFRKVLDIIGESDKKVIMLSPYTYDKLDSMKQYMEKYCVIEENRNKKFVKHELHNLTRVADYKKYFNDNSTTYKAYSNSTEKVCKILEKLKNDENIIYINSPSFAETLINKIKDEGIILPFKTDDRYLIFLKHLEENYNVDEISEWYLIAALKMGIGIYVSSMPRYIKREIVNLFNLGIIKNLIVTTAFIEGVNSVAKNIIITSQYTGGRVKLNEMSLLNIAGRAGRFGNNFVGHVYFIKDETFKIVEEKQSKGVSLSNPNYEVNTTNNIRNDYEIEMIDERYLNEMEKQRKSEIIKNTIEINLDYDELKNVCVCVPMEWKIKLYRFFENNQEMLEEIRKDIEDILMPENERVVEGMTNIFTQMNLIGIPLYSYKDDIYAFKINGEFLWGKFYKQHLNGNIKSLLSSKKIYILSEKNRLSKESFEKTWMSKYFNADGEFNDSKLYEGTFKFISNIIEYKIPYFISFYIGMFKFYIMKNNIKIDDSIINFDEAINKIETIGLDERIAPYRDYGFPIYIIDKILKLEKDLKEYNIDELDEFDDYEKVILKEYIDVI